jgi:hypothetical protein
MAMPRPVAAVAGTELALLSTPSISPQASEKPYQVEARIEAARQSSDAEIKLRLWLEALALAPADQRVRVGALRAAISQRQDALSLSLEKSQGQPQLDFGVQVPSNTPRRPRYAPYGPPESAAILPRAPLNAQERASIAESLAAAAERLNDLNAAQAHLRAAIDLRPPDQRDVLVRRLNAIIAEQERRTKNAARQPVIKNVIEQDRIVRPEIARSAQ